MKDYVGEARSWARLRAMGSIDRMLDAHLAAMESPLEAAFFLGLIAHGPMVYSFCDCDQEFILADSGYVVAKLGAEPAVLSATWAPRDGLGVHLRVWAQVGVGPYRADFVLQQWDRGAEATVVVELDGRDFHASDEQRRGDRARDRYMRRRGLTVVRFAGALVYESVHACVQQALGALTPAEVVA